MQIFFSPLGINYHVFILVVGPYVSFSKHLGIGQ